MLRRGLQRAGDPFRSSRRALVCDNHLQHSGTETALPGARSSTGSTFQMESQVGPLRAALRDLHAAGNLPIALPIGLLVGDQRIVHPRLDGPCRVDARLVHLPGHLELPLGSIELRPVAVVH
jgi:hypothetical protein